MRLEHCAYIVFRSVYLPCILRGGDSLQTVIEIVNVGKTPAHKTKVMMPVVKLGPNFQEEDVSGGTFRASDSGFVLGPNHPYPCYAQLPHKLSQGEFNAIPNC